MEDMLVDVVKEVKNIIIDKLFFCMIYKEVMDCFGSDKLDICFGLELVNVFDVVKDVDFKVF